jgi:FkbM family methyltransferase
MAIAIRRQHRYILATTAVVILFIVWIGREPEEINEQKPDDFSVTVNLDAYPVIKLDDFLLPPHPPRKHRNPNRKFSQAGQDAHVYRIFRKTGGFFVDIGANDGLYFSNTLWLERQHGWSGLLIEANPGLCKHIDALKRHAWRLCACLSNTVRRASFVRADGVGGVENNLDSDHVKQFNITRKVVVPCFSMAEVLDKVNIHHIDFYSLDVEGAEMVILESMRKELASRKMTVDIWAIEYRVWDGKQIVVNKSMENLRALRQFFKEVGGYVEHSHLSNDDNNEIGYALDVIFVNKNTWCSHRPILPNGESC